MFLARCDAGKVSFFENPSRTTWSKLLNGGKMDKKDKEEERG